MNANTVIIRSLDLAQGTPFLEQAWQQILNQEPDASLWISGQPRASTKLPANALRFESIDGSVNVPDITSTVVSWSVPNERTIEDIVLAGDTPTVPGPLSAVAVLADKRATKGLLKQFDVPTPNGVVLDRGFIEGGLLDPSFRRRLERQLVAHLHYPLIVKPVWDSMGHGSIIVHDEDGLMDALTSSVGRDLLVEEFFDGHAGSLEIIGEPGDYHLQPICWTGPSAQGVMSNFDTIRIAHPGIFRHARGMAGPLTSLLASINFRGACCVDFVTDGDSVEVLEINPRVSGASCLTAAASGVDAFDASYRIAVGRWSDRPKRSGTHRAALQAGGAWAAHLACLLDRSDCVIERYRDEGITVDGLVSRSIIIGAETRVIEELVQFLGIFISPSGNVALSDSGSVVEFLDGNQSQDF